MKNRNATTTKMVMTGLLAAMVAIMTAYNCHIPYGANGGYIHYGDALIYVAAVLLPRPYALVAAAVGGGLADLLTAPLWAPATIVIKMLITLPFTSKEGRVLCPRNAVAPFAAALVSATGYWLAEGLLFGNFVAPLVSFAGSAVQSGGSAAIFLALAVALDRIHLKQKIMPTLGMTEKVTSKVKVNR